MRLHYLKHVTFEGPAEILNWALDKGWDISYTHMYEGGSLPDPAEIDILVIMGGPMSVNDEELYSWLPRERKFVRQVIDTGRRVFGICLGAQLIAHCLGSHVFPNQHKEIGWFPVKNIDKDSDLFRDLPLEFMAFHWHGETFDIPEGALHSFSSVACPNQGFTCHDGRVIALQFHLESSETSIGSLVENCADELVKGPYIQDGEFMKAQSEHLRESNEALRMILDRWLMIS